MRLLARLKVFADLKWCRSTSTTQVERCLKRLRHISSGTTSLYCRSISHLLPPLSSTRLEPTYKVPTTSSPLSPQRCWRSLYQFLSPTLQFSPWSPPSHKEQKNSRGKGSVMRTRIYLRKEQLALLFLLSSQHPRGQSHDLAERKSTQGVRGNEITANSEAGHVYCWATRECSQTASAISVKLTSDWAIGVAQATIQSRQTSWYLPSQHIQPLQSQFLNLASHHPWGSR